MYCQIAYILHNSWGHHLYGSQSQSMTLLWIYAIWWHLMLQIGTCIARFWGKKETIPRRYTYFTIYKRLTALLGWVLEFRLVHKMGLVKIVFYKKLVIFVFSVYYFMKKGEMCIRWGQLIKFQIFSWHWL